MDLSIVIPAYNESGKIGRDIKQAAEFLNANNFEGQIIVVDDGSDDNTADTAKKIEIPKGIELEVISYQEHHGKGYAVCAGMRKTTGEYIMFADSGSCVPYEDTLRGLDMLKKDICDIAHGSRKMSGCHIKKAQSLFRRICSKLFHWFVVYDMKVPAELTDTQCGFKIYKGDLGRHLYGECFTEGFAFDIEIIIRALKEGYRIKEFPIDWSCDPDSRLSPTRSSWRILSELLAIRRKVNGKQ